MSNARSFPLYFLPAQSNEKESERETRWLSIPAQRETGLSYQNAEDRCQLFVRFAFRSNAPVDLFPASRHTATVLPESSIYANTSRMSVPGSVSRFVVLQMKPQRARRRHMHSDNTPDS